MKLVASVMCRNEINRYLQPCLNHLARFCDRIVVYDDMSDDGTLTWLRRQAAPKNSRLTVVTPHQQHPQFFLHEGRARQQLLDAVLAEQPDYVLAIDADEFISDGQLLRSELERHPGLAVRTLCMQEVWGADGQLHIRWDGAWCPHEVPIVWKPEVGGFRAGRRVWAMGDHKLACPRTPVGIRSQGAQYADTSILHFGWANVTERQARYDRYMEHDQGKHHNLKHLSSIMYNAHNVHTVPIDWPEALQPWRNTIVEAANHQKTSSDRVSTDTRSA